MFDLEQSIVEWKRQMQAAGLKDPGLLDELESHLLEEVESQMKSGAAAEEAFEKAVEQIGQAKTLKQEFKKIAGIKQLKAWMKRSTLTLAGIPKQYLDESMKTSFPNNGIEPAWATYLKAAVFVAPAVCLWELALLFCVPSLMAVCQQAGGPSLPELFRINLGIAELLKDNFLYLSGGALVVLLLLEWRARHWPRYRRAFVGFSAFILNFSVLISLFLIVVMGAIVAQAAIHPLK